MSSHLRGAQRPGETGTSLTGKALHLSHSQQPVLCQDCSEQPLWHSPTLLGLLLPQLWGSQSKCWTILFKRQTPTWPNLARCNPITVNLTGIHSYKLTHGNVFNQQIMNYLSAENFLSLNLQYTVRLHLCSLGLYASINLRIMNKPLRIILVVELYVIKFRLNCFNKCGYF